MCNHNIFGQFKERFKHCSERFDFRGYDFTTRRDRRWPSSGQQGTGQAEGTSMIKQPTWCWCSKDIINCSGAASLRRSSRCCCLCWATSAEGTRCHSQGGAEPRIHPNRRSGGKCPASVSTCVSTSVNQVASSVHYILLNALSTAWIMKLEGCLHRNYFSFYGVSSRERHSVNSWAARGPSANEVSVNG